MAGRVTVLTPVDNTPAIELGKSTWRKQILPVGWLNYDDGTSKRLLNFTPDYLRNLVTAFKAKAFDGVPLQLADAANRHNNDPERTAGQIIGLDSDDKGLYATVSTNDRGSALLEENKNLGVSVRIVEDYERQDGKSATPHKAALQHVLATWAPRVAGMAPWQAVACSDESEGRVIDLSELVFTADGTAEAAPKPPTSSPQGGKEGAGPMAELTDKELADLKAIAPTLLKLIEGGGSGEEDAAADADDVTTPPVVPTPPVVDDEADEDDADDDADDSIAASYDDGTGNTLELAVAELRAARDRDAIELAQNRAELDAERYRREFQEMTVELGLPPALVNIAKPLLWGRGHAVELSHGGQLDAGKVVRDLLSAVAKTYPRAVDLSGPIGSAHEIAASEADDAQMDSVITRAQAARFAR